MKATNPSPSPWLIADFNEGGFQTLDLVRNDILAAIVPVILRSPTGDISALGTAFCIGTLRGGYALYATARHVVECLKQASSGTEPFVIAPQSMKSDGGLTAVRISGIRMKHPYSDAALLTVDLGSSVQPLDYEGPRALSLTLTRPKVGEHCMALGYSDLDVIKANQNVTEITTQQRLHASQGTIEEVHSSARDALSITFPSFRSDAFYASGMSGGPIFCESGYVIGFVCSSFDASSGISYGAHIATLMEVSIDAPGDNGEQIDTTLGALMQSGQMDWCDVGSSVTIQRTNDGVIIDWPGDPAERDEL